MHVDKVELSWDAGRHKWMVRIEAGSEVIRRFCDQPHDSGDEKLRAAAQQTVVDEGYEVDESRILVIR